MEVRKGFKQTEFGVIPKDWDAISIQELMDSNAIIGHLDGNHGALYPRSNEFVEFGVPYITANELTGYKVSFETCKYLSQERARRFRKGVAKNGDVLFAHNATVGPTALLSTELDYVILSTTATYFRCNPEKIKNTFLLYALQSQHFVGQYRAVMAQSTRNQVPITTQRKLFFILPSSLAEQEAIAEALSDADALIEAVEQLIAKKRQVKQGAMSELLTGKRRLAGFGTKLSYKQTEVGEIPEDWEIKMLGNIAPIATGNTPPTRDLENYGDVFLFVSPVDLGSAKYISRTEKMLSKKGFSISRSFPKGSILFVCIGSTIGKCGIATETLTSNQQINAILPSEGFSSDYLYYAVTAVAPKIKSLAGEQAVPIVNKTQFSETLIPLPPTLAEQTAIAEILSDMDAEISALEEKLVKARQVKAGMMSELLGGKIRLNRD